MTDNTAINKKFIDAVVHTVNGFNMLEKNDAVLVAVSGGPDSTALVLSLEALKEQFNITLGIAHLNHLLRGEDALKDEAFVKTLAKKSGLPVYVSRADARTHAKKHRLSVEEAGRNLRYQFFRDLSDHHGYNKIATGHNRDDNAELVLMNLLRGSGIKGLSGIPPIREGKFIRPLIRIPKKRILAFLAAENQDYRIDTSNFDKTYLRNRIRNELIPHLESEYNPEIRDALDRLSCILKTEDDFLDLETRRCYTSCLIKKDISSVTLSIPLLADLHPAMVHRVFRKAVKGLKKDLKRISLAHIHDIIGFCFHSSADGSLDLPGQIRVYKQKEMVMIKKENRPLREIGRQDKALKQKIQEKKNK